MENQPAANTELSPLNTIRVETALSRYPVHRLARKGSIDINISKESSQGKVTSWEVDYSRKHGQPGPLAYKIDTLIINRRIEEARRPIPRMLRLGSLSDICRELNLADSGKNRSDIKNALFQNAFAGITAKTHYRQGDGSERTLEAAFTRYSVILTGEKLPSGQKADAVYVVLNDVFIRVINGAMTRPLDYDYLKSLPPAPQRFYELLSYHMYAALLYDRARARLVYSDLCAHAPQMRHYEWEKVRSQMTKVHRPHLQSGYIAKVESQPATDAEGKADWIFFYLPGPKARSEFRVFAKRGGPNVLEVEPLEPPTLDGTPLSEIEHELIRHGITDVVARQLAAEHPEEKIRLQMEILDWRLSRKNGQAVEDPAAYLVSAIRSGSDGHAVPKGFVSAAERQRRQEAKQARERQAAEERRRQHEQKARDGERDRKVAAYWASLTQEQQTALQAEADALADPETLAREANTLGTDALRRMGQQIRRQEYIQRLLDAQEQEGAQV